MHCRKMPTVPLSFWKTSQRVEDTTADTNEAEPLDSPMFDEEDEA